MFKRLSRNRWIIVLYTEGAAPSHFWTGPDWSNENWSRDPDAAKLLTEKDARKELPRLHVRYHGVYAVRDYGTDSEKVIQ